MKTYRIAEIFGTVQGEGANVGSRAVFVRFAGCNRWSGKDATRAADAARTGSSCPLWCDTDFTVRAKMTAEEICAAVAAEMSQPDMIVLTGGEPLLQLDAELATALSRFKARLALETNGTIRVPSWFRGWICVSPKVALSQLEQTYGHELKVVLPAHNPEDYFPIAHRFQHRFVQPLAATSGVGVSLIDKAATAAAVAWVAQNPGWRLGAQLHKVIGVR